MLIGRNKPRDRLAAVGDNYVLASSCRLDQLRQLVFRLENIDLHASPFDEPSTWLYIAK